MLAHLGVDQDKLCQLQVFSDTVPVGVAAHTVGECLGVAAVPFACRRPLALIGQGLAGKVAAALQADAGIH